MANRLESPPRDYGGGHRALYVGYSADLYCKYFLPRYVEGPIDGIDWPRELANVSARRLKTRINALANSGRYAVLLIALDHDPFFYFDEVLKLSQQLPTVGIFGDDTNMPQYASLLASACWSVLTTDPLQLDRYRSLGIPASLHSFDISPDRYPNLGLKRHIDLLIYGQRAKGRRDEIEYLKTQVSDLRVLDLTADHVPFDDLLLALNQSRVTVNWTDVWQQPLVNNFRDPLFPKYEQLKGRVLEAALTGCVPVSTPSEAQKRVFGDILPVFRGRSELIIQIRALLADDERREESARHLGNLAREYIQALPDDLVIRSGPISITQPPNGAQVDEVAATYRLLGLLLAITQGRFANFLQDVSLVRWHRVRWRFVVRHLMRRLRFRNVN